MTDSAAGLLDRRVLDPERRGPDLDWVSLAGGLGVPGTRVATADALAEALRRGFAASGPSLIEAVL